MNTQALPKILLVDDDLNFILATKVHLKFKYAVLGAVSVAEAIKIISKTDVDAILLDIGLKNENGLDGIRKIHKAHPWANIIILSASRNVSDVVRAIREGAIDYLTKPIDINALVPVMEKTIMLRRKSDITDAMRREPLSGNAKIIFRAECMQKLLDDCALVKGHNANVLIVGETGTGKELIARQLHKNENDPSRPFIAVNCAAIPEHLLESELFGHESGAFTGALRRRIGKFELADGGDIFLDEIGSLKGDMQVKLLRVIQEREFFRLGSNMPIKINFRVIAATNRPLEELVDEGAFRLDLYHRLKIIQLDITPLKQRIEDIPILVEHFLKLHSPAGATRITESAMMRLMEYPWPGNVRELSNVIQSLVIMGGQKMIDENIFPQWILNGSTARAASSKTQKDIDKNSRTVMPLSQYLKSAERRYIQRVLEQNSNDKTKTSKELSIGRTTLYLKMKELGI